MKSISKQHYPTTPLFQFVSRWYFLLIYVLWINAKDYEGNADLIKHECVDTYGSQLYNNSLFF